MSYPVGSVFLYRLVSGLYGAPVVPPGWEIASDPCARYGSVWLRQRVPREVRP